MHLGRKWIYGEHILKDSCHVWLKTAKIQDGCQRPFEQNRFLTNNPIINCDLCKFQWQYKCFYDVK